jgi:hypothetical protein
MARQRGIQTSSLIVGVVIGFLLYAIFRHLFYILIGIAVGALAVAYLRRR